MSLKRLLLIPVVIAASAPTATLAAPRDQLHSRTWTLSHLGPNGLAKCRAFKSVVRDTMALQKAGDGVISPIERRRLNSKLAAARAMTPERVTARDCGVPL